MTEQIRQWKDKATSYLRKKKYSKALELYEKVLAEEPQDFSSLKTVGYILRKLDRRSEAVEVYVKLAEAYAQQGFLLKAIATCKVVLEVDPAHQQVQNRLAALYAKQPDTSQPAMVKVMFEPDSDVQIGDQAVVPLSPVGLHESEPAQEDEHMFSVDVTTDLKDLEPMQPAQPEFDLDVEVLEQDSSQEEKILPEIPLFSELDPEAFVSVLEEMRLILMKPGDWIIHEGDKGRSMFTIARGAVRVLKRIEGEKMVQLASLGEGAFFGEMSVLRGGPRGASVQAVRTGELFEISKELLDRTIEKHPGVQEVLIKFAKQRLLRNVLRTSALFKPFSQEERTRILERFLRRDVKQGEELIREGEPSSGFFVVLRGQMNVLHLMEDGTTTLVGRLKEGEVFGEISCLYQEPAVASVRVATPASILRLPRKDFQELILSHPQILELVAELGEQRRALTANTLADKGILI